MRYLASVDTCGGLALGSGPGARPSPNASDHCGAVIVWSRTGGGAIARPACSPKIIRRDPLPLNPGLPADGLVRRGLDGFTWNSLTSLRSARLLLCWGQWGRRTLRSWFTRTGRNGDASRHGYVALVARWDPGLSGRRQQTPASQVATEAGLS
jgi:hypothetical protein